MQVSPINNNNQTSFNGYLGKSFKQLSQKCLKTKIQDIVDSANVEKVSVNVEELNGVIDSSKHLLARFEAFMAKLHPKTELITGPRNSFYLINHITGAYLEIDSAPDLRKPQFAYRGVKAEIPYYFLSESSKKDGWRQTLETSHLVKLISGLECLDPDGKGIESRMYEAYKSGVIENARSTSIYDRIMTFFDKRNADKIAKEMGQPSFMDEINKALEFREERRSREREVKRIIKQNEKIQKDFLK